MAIGGISAKGDCVEPLVYISRYFVEFGPFTGTEVADLHKRRVLGPTDYAREAGSERWMPVSEWLLLRGKKEKKTRLVQKPTGAWGATSRRPIKAPTRKKTSSESGMPAGETKGDY